MASHELWRYTHWAGSVTQPWILHSLTANETLLILRVCSAVQLCEPKGLRCNSRLRWTKRWICRILRLPWYLQFYTTRNLILRAYVCCYTYVPSRALFSSDCTRGLYRCMYAQCAKLYLIARLAGRPMRKTSSPNPLFHPRREDIQSTIGRYLESLNKKKKLA